MSTADSPHIILQVPSNRDGSYLPHEHDEECCGSYQLQERPIQVRLVSDPADKPNDFNHKLSSLTKEIISSTFRVKPVSKKHVWM